MAAFPGTLANIAHDLPRCTTRRHKISPARPRHRSGEECVRQGDGSAVGERGAGGREQIALGLDTTELRAKTTPLPPPTLQNATFKKPMNSAGNDARSVQLPSSAALTIHHLAIRDARGITRRAATKT